MKTITRIPYNKVTICICSLTKATAQILRMMCFFVQKYCSLVFKIVFAALTSYEIFTFHWYDNLSFTLFQILIIGL